MIWNFVRDLWSNQTDRVLSFCDACSGILKIWIFFQDRARVSSENQLFHVEHYVGNAAMFHVEQFGR
ncbi:hypothetical protein BBB39_20655 [Bordetella trematum]|nr:hypothetical protein BBB39_20655 [Bordetella trematum]